jgi:hypothetical protein
VPAGEVAENEVRTRRRAVPAPTIRALAVLVMLAVALLWVTGALGATGASSRPTALRRSGVEVLGEQVARPAVTTTTATTPVSSTTTGAPTSTAPRVPVPVTTGVTAAPARPAVAMSCADALAYLASHQAPGFTDVCSDGSAFGHLGVTCVNQPGMCEGMRYVHIACPAPFVYMNEAHNSWVLTGQRTGIDPYGQGSAAERAACASRR